MKQTFCLILLGLIFNSCSSQYYNLYLVQDLEKSSLALVSNSDIELSNGFRIGSISNVNLDENLKSVTYELQILNDYSISKNTTVKIMQRSLIEDDLFLVLDFEGLKPHYQKEDTIKSPIVIKTIFSRKETIKNLKKFKDGIDSTIKILEK